MCAGIYRTHGCVHYGLRQQKYRYAVPYRLHNADNVFGCRIFGKPNISVLNGFKATAERIRCLWHIQIHANIKYTDTDC